MIMCMFQRRKGASWITKIKNVSLFAIKMVCQGYNIWNCVTQNTVYSQNVLFREVKEVPIQEVTTMKKEPKTPELELEDEESD